MLDRPQQVIGPFGEMLALEAFAPAEIVAAVREVC